MPRIFHLGDSGLYGSVWASSNRGGRLQLDPRNLHPRASTAPQRDVDGVDCHIIVFPTGSIYDGKRLTVSSVTCRQAMDLNHIAFLEMVFEIHGLKQPSNFEDFFLAKAGETTQHNFHGKNLWFLFYLFVNKAFSTLQQNHPVVNCSVTIFLIRIILFWYFYGRYIKLSKVLTDLTIYAIIFPGKTVVAQ